MVLHDRFKEKLRQALNERGWSQSELSRRLGFALPVTRRYIFGERCPGLDMVAKFEAALGVEHGSLIDDQPLRLLELAGS